MLNADQLGKLGESYFRVICDRVALICNKSDRDETGWDFFVQFHFDPLDARSTLDKRVAPIACHIQVKTMRNHNDAFQMRLSSAEWLAKEPKPAFIYVLKVNDQLEAVEAYLIHMLDNNLATVLKRLRKEQAKHKDKVNNVMIAFSASRAGQRLEPTGEAFRDAISKLCDKGIAPYFEEKAKQVKNLGFNLQRIEGHVTLIGHQEEMVDAFLESVRKVLIHEPSLASRRTMRRMLASMTKAMAVRVRFSKSLA
ncbi:MAG: hypothetical protein ACLQME_10215, partial [Alphaproteobacteria bacterium]